MGGVHPLGQAGTLTRGAHPEKPLPALTISPDLSRGNPANDFGQGQPALLATFASAPEQGSKQTALICQPLLIIFCLKSAWPTLSNVSKG